MAYATAEQLKEHVGEDRYHDLADRDASGAPDEEGVAQALAAASSIADSYLTRYLPIAPPYPDVLVDAVVVIATYRLAGTRATDTDRQDYEDAMAWLRDVGARRASLALPEGSATVPGGDVLVDAEPARYRHDQTRRVL